MSQRDGINVPLAATLGLASAVFLLVTVFGLQAWFNYEVQVERDEMWTTLGDKTAMNVREKQAESIRVNDPAHGKMPIDAAMEKIIQAGGKVPWKTN
jgi:hypothetical protein